MRRFINSILGYDVLVIFNTSSNYEAIRFRMRYIPRKGELIYMKGFYKIESVLYYTISDRFNISATLYNKNNQN